MKKTYSSPRLTEYGTVKEIARMFGFPSEEDKKEVALESALISQCGSTGTGSDSPRVVG